MASPATGKECRVVSRLMFGLSGLVIAWTLHVTQRSDFSRPMSPPVELVVGQFHAVNVDADRAVLDLPCAADQRYLLIVSSLGDSSHTYRVRLESEPVAAVKRCSTKPIDPAPLSLWGRGAGGEGSARHETTIANWPLQNANCKLELSNSRLRQFAFFNLQWPICNSSECHSAPSPRPSPPKGERDASVRRPFDIHVGSGSLDDASNYVRVTGRSVAESKSVRVFLDEQQAFDSVKREAATEILHLLENRIIPRSRELIDTHADIDGDGKLAVLLTPVLDRVPAGQTPLGGYVRGSDFRRDISPPFGNHADVIYLNSRAMSPGEHLHALLAHEYTHAVGFSEQWRMSADGSPVHDEEDWLNEAIAHVAEQQHHAGWSNLDYRIDRFLHAPHSAPLVVPDASRAGLWRDPGCRGASYLFLQWCVDQFGDDLLSKLIHSRRRGRANIEHATGVPFAELYRRWTIALCDDVSESSAIGYRTLRLHGPLGGAVLDGPTTIVWPLERLVSHPPLRGDTINFTLRGTATAFVELRAPTTGGARRITIAADSGTALQLTLMPLVGTESSPLLVANKPPQPR
jgi:hypothetical protein